MRTIAVELACAALLLALLLAPVYLVPVLFEAVIR